jgi:hypothetical protein
LVHTKAGAITGSDGGTIDVIRTGSVHRTDASGASTAVHRTESGPITGRRRELTAVLEAVAEAGACAIAGAWIDLQLSTDRLPIDTVAVAGKCDRRDNSNECKYRQDCERFAEHYSFSLWSFGRTSRFAYPHIEPHQRELPMAAIKKVL